MSDDNVVEFPGKSENTSSIKMTERASADEILELAKGKFEDVIIIGMNPGGSKCISSIDVEESIFQLSRAIYKLHGALDELYRRG